LKHYDINGMILVTRHAEFLEGVFVKHKRSEITGSSVGEALFERTSVRSNKIQKKIGNKSSIYPLVFFPDSVLIVALSTLPTDADAVKFFRFI
jgi:hypothetical protein